ncbi:MAG: hypothetical protein ACR2L3_04945 [Actinomycetota bacterium]
MVRSLARSPRRAAAGVIALLLMLPVGSAHGLPVGAPESSRHGREIDQILQRRLVDQLAALDVPEAVIDRIRSADASVDTARLVYGLPGPDLDGDRIRDVIEWDITLKLSAGMGPQEAVPGIKLEGETRIRIRRGSDGKFIWKKHYDDFVIPVAARVGQKGERGLLAVGGLLSFFTNEPYINLEALTGTKGKALWFKEYRSVASDGVTQAVVVDAPISLSIFDGAPGRADDVVIGISTLVSTLTDYTAATRSVLLRGTDGSDTLHPTVDLGIDWLPYPVGLSDQGLDGLDDYAVTNSIGIDKGGSQEPPSVGGTIYVRKGTDGSELWTTSGLEFTDFASAYSLPNVTGGRAKEVAIYTARDPEHERMKTYLLEGGFGPVRWEKDGFAAAPGGVNDEGVIDILLDEVFANEETRKVRYEQVMVESSGKKIWDRTVRWTYEGAPCPLELCFSSLFLSAYVMGDVDVDSVAETLGFFSSNQNGLFNDQVSFLLDGKNGRTIFRRKALVQSARTAVDGRGVDLSMMNVYRGNFRLKILDGEHQRTLWKSSFVMRDKIPAKRVSLFADGFDIGNDRCGEQIFTLNDFNGNATYYVVLDGASGRPIWGNWSGKPAEKPALRKVSDLNTAC